MDAVKLKQIRECTVFKIVNPITNPVYVAKQCYHYIRVQTTMAVFLLICFLYITASNAFAQKNANKEEWMQLFNGKDLTDWDIKITGYDLNNNYSNTFRVEEGLLKVRYDEYPQFRRQFGHIYYKQLFSYYKLRVEYRFVKEQATGGAPGNERNSGIMLHSQPAQNIMKNQLFPISLEFQLLGGLGKGPRTTANLCTPGTYIQMNNMDTSAHCINSSSKTCDGDRWVKVEAVVLGDSIIHHIVEGDTVLTYRHPKVGEIDARYKIAFLNEEWQKKTGTTLKEGYIALQSESHPIDFRKVELLNLKGCMNLQCPKYKSYYVAQGTCDCKSKIK